MASFLSLIAAPAVQQVTEKGLFGGLYVRLGRLFVVIGSWVYQQGGALGYGLREEPGLLGRLLLQSRSRASREEAAEYVRGFRETVASQLEQVERQEKTFFLLYTVPQLRERGIDITAWPPSKRLDEKMSGDFASDVTWVSFVLGGALGYHFPETVREYWEHSFRIRPDHEWEEMRAQGLVLSEIQQTRPLEGAVAELAAAAVAWATADAPGFLDSRELEILSSLARAADHSRE